MKAFFSRLLLLLSTAPLLLACVPNRKIVYLQKDDVNRKNLPKDTIVRSYNSTQYDYRIQPQDIISVRFESLTPKDLDFLNQTTANVANTSNFVGGALMVGELVDQHGEIPVLFLGKVKVGGLTVFEIQDKLQVQVSAYLEKPVVRVRLINFRFTVLGQVLREGTTVISNNRVNIMEAIGWAGGLDDLADRSNIKLVREINGRTTIQYIDLLKENFINSPYYYLHQNDIIIVPPLRQRTYRNYFGQNLALVISVLSLIVLTVNLTKK